MDDFAKMDAFFMVTTVTVVLLAAIFVVVAYYVVRVLRVIDDIARDARDVARDVKQASERVIDDVDTVRGRVAGAFNAISSLVRLRTSFFKAKPARERKATRPARRKPARPIASTPNDTN